MNIYHWVCVAYQSNVSQFTNDSPLITMSMEKHLQAVVLALSKYFITKITRINVGKNAFPSFATIFFLKRN